MIGPAWRQFNHPMKLEISLTKSVAGNVKTKAQERWDLSDAKASHDIHQTGSVNGRANVNGKGEEADFKSDKESFSTTPVARILYTSASRIVLHKRSIPVDHLVQTSR